MTTKRLTEILAILTTLLALVIAAKKVVDAFKEAADKD